MRPDDAGGTSVTDGPFTESVEQIVGFSLIKSDDEHGLRTICERFSSRGELIEFHTMAEQPPNPVRSHPSVMGQCRP